VRGCAGSRSEIDNPFERVLGLTLAVIVKWNGSVGQQWGDTRGKTERVITLHTNVQLGIRTNTRCPDGDYKNGVNSRHEHEELSAAKKRERSNRR